MGVASWITDKLTGNTAEVDVTRGERNSLVVSTRELKTYTAKIRFFMNDTYGSDMNQDASIGGVPVNIHNGIDNVYWTGSAISGTWTFNSAAQAHAGAQSIDATATQNNQTAQIAAGAGQSLAGYVSLSGWIYITGWSFIGTKAVNIFGWDTGTTAMVGTSVNIGDYVDTTTFNTWQQFVIPLGDMALTGLTIDAIRIVTINTGGGPAPNYYLDDVQIEQTGTPLDYFIRPSLGTWLHVDTVQISIADAYTGIVTVAGATENATMAGIPYDTLLGVPALTNGITYQLVQGGTVTETGIIRQLSDWLQRPNSELINTISDGTNTCFTIRHVFPHPVILKPEGLDRLRILINDDLSGLLLFRIAAGCREEARNG